MSNRWLDEADRNFMNAFHRLACASTEPRGFPNEAWRPEAEWEEFERELAAFIECARLRHLAKHYAIREATISATPMIVVIEGEGQSRILDGINHDELRALVGK